MKKISKKLAAVVLIAIVTALNDYFGQPISSDAMLTITGAIGAWLVGQGIADAGAGGSTRLLK